MLTFKNVLTLATPGIGQDQILEDAIAHLDASFTGHPFSGKQRECHLPGVCR